MIRRPPRSTRTDTLFPTRRSSDLPSASSSAGTACSEGSDAKAPTTATRTSSSGSRASAKRARSEGGAREERIARRFWAGVAARSEEHTSELQSLMRISYAVFCLKKKKTKKKNTHINKQLTG